MAKLVSIDSQSQLDTILKSHNYVVADFYADWCGPCKQIAPLVQKLANENSSRGKLAFVKVNVDNQQDVAKKYGVSAMPTFLVFRKESVVKTIRGANPAALQSAVSKIAKDSGAGSSFSSSTGHVLGSASQAPKRSSQPFTGQGLMAAIIRFVMLYITTLLSLDPVAAAKASPYSKARR
ncbi:hypothetical protein MMC10_007476 [Thelotrema lepadinum]|nr:hypothetical protein [Thelotrema lepadinum]